MNCSFYQVDVFTKIPFGGNPLAVVFDSEGLTDQNMLNIAKEMNLSETTFVLSPGNLPVDFLVRIFTPEKELPFAGHPILGSADYKLVHHCKSGRSVYSFCMCPGGTVVAATSEEGCVVTNGMSQYSRNERNANAAIVVGIEPERDYPGHILAGIDLQRELEKRAYELGGRDYSAPAQLVGDFLKNKASTELSAVAPSYQPGIKLGDLSQALPEFAISAIREAIPAFNKKIKGFAMNDAILTGVETRTSSPICIKRNGDLQSLNTKGLYPAGEGAGYAGGILSAGIDGIKVAEALAKSLLNIEEG